MANYNIRGGLGTQILSLYTCYALALENKTSVDKIYFNGGNYSPFVKDQNIIFFDDLLSFKDKPVVEFINGTNKTSPFNQSNIKLLFKHWEEIQTLVCLKKSYRQSLWDVLHIRQLDRALVSIDKFDSIREKSILRWKIISDDPAVCSKYNLEKTDGTISDWETVLCANKVLGGYSTFTLLAAILNPKMQLDIISRENCIPGILSDSDWEAINMYVDEFENIKFEKLDWVN